MKDSRRVIQLRSYGLALAVALSPALFQTGFSCDRGDTYLLSLQFEVGGQDLIQNFNINNRSGYAVTTASCTATLTVQTRMVDSTASYQWIVGGTSIEAGLIGLGGGSVALNIPPGQSTLYVAVRAAEGIVGGYWVDVDRTAQAGTITIEFDDGVENDPVESFYEAQGVTFSPNTRWVLNLVGVIYVDGGDATPPMSISTPPDYKPSFDNPIVATFCEPQSLVSILAVNVGAAGARLDAYDAITGGALVGFAEGFGVTDFGEIPVVEGGCGGGSMLLCQHEERLLSVSASSIRRIEVYRALDLSIDGVHFDNLTFEPASGP